MNQSISRPNTPKSATKNSIRNAGTPPPVRSSSALSLPLSRPVYPRFKTQSSNDWTTEEGPEDDEQDEEIQYMYSENIDEDEFGLPSISSMRRQSKRIPRSKVHDPGGGRDNIKNDPSLLNTTVFPSRERANSADIAEERGPPEYPSGIKSEDKILRPQYKDILRGLLVPLFRRIEY